VVIQECLGNDKLGFFPTTKTDKINTKSRAAIVAGSFFVFSPPSACLSENKR